MVTKRFYASKYATLVTGPDYEWFSSGTKEIEYFDNGYGISHQSIPYFHFNTLDIPMGSIIHSAEVLVSIRRTSSQTGDARCYFSSYSWDSSKPIRYTGNGSTSSVWFSRSYYNEQPQFYTRIDITNSLGNLDKIPVSERTLIFLSETQYAIGTNLYPNYPICIEISYTPPPSTPSSITVPTEVKGGESITISWGSSSDATRYHLERSVDGGSWTQIYQGSNRSYTDTITKGWKTVAYRVRAYNEAGYSSYRTSPTITVINFPEMQIKVNGVLKTSDAGWVKINGQLREIDSILVKVNGILKEVQ